MLIKHRRFCFSAAMIAILSASAGASLGAKAPPLRVATDPSNGVVSMLRGGQPCWTYVPQSPEGKPYFHPLAIPGTDEAITGHRPADHVWHLGLWFSWKFINGANFWEPDTNGVTSVIEQNISWHNDLTFTAEAVLAYLVRGEEAVREKRSVRVDTEPDGDYTIAWDSLFSAQDKEAVFECTPAKKDKSGNWASGGYAGLTLRLADSPAFFYTCTNAQGHADVKACGEPSAQIQIIAKSSASGAQARLTFTDHPDNPRHPTPWFVRHSAAALKGRGYYLIGPSMIFHEPLTLRSGQSARFRYTLKVERFTP